MGLRGCEEDDVKASPWQSTFPCRLPQNSLAAIPEHGVSKPFWRNEGDFVQAAFVIPQHTNSQEGIVQSLPAREDLLKFFAGFDGLHESSLDSEPLATLGTTTGENGAAPLGSHAGTEAVGGSTLPLVGLIRTLHVYSSHTGLSSQRDKPKHCNGLARLMSIYLRKSSKRS